MYRPDGKPTRRWLATTGVILAIIAAVWFNQHQGLRSVTDQLAQQSLENCKEIEANKAQQRKDATEEHNNLERNARLLGITLTPELRAAVDAEYQHKMDVYAPSKCPRN